MHAVFNLHKQDTINSQQLNQHTTRLMRVQNTLYDVWRALDLLASIIAMIGLGIAVYSVSLNHIKRG